MQKISFLAILMVLTVSVWAESYMSGDEPVEAVAKKGSISGKIIEAGSSTPLEYANIAIYALPDSSLAGGGIADAAGRFMISDLEPGSYLLDAKFIGFEHTKLNNITIANKQMKVDLGTIELHPASENLAEVNVVAQENPIAYQIDKKVVDPSQFPTAANGTATDVLANTPSVVVDIEGNVTMRGSSSFTVLIDGRPTPFDAADALDQIPASSIHNIEIITNPSAKYDPDGNAGIININTKKSKLIGVSGIVNASGDSNGSLSGDVLLNYRIEKFNFFVNGDLSKRQRQGEFSSINRTWADADTSSTESDGTGKRGRDAWSLKTGFDYYMNEQNTLTFNVGVDGRKRFSESISNFHEYTSSGYDRYSLTENIDDGDQTGVSLSLDYKKTFDRDGQELTAYFYYENENGFSSSLYNQYDGSDVLLEGIKNWEAGGENQFRFQTDYIHPFNEKMKFEAGYQLRADRENEWNDVHWYTTFDNYEPSESSAYYTDTYFDRDIHSAYSIFSNSGNIMGYQLGLRAEYTDRSMSYDDKVHTINRLDFFPTVHFSFQLPLEQQLITSYTRRIERPRGYYLEPFITYEDAYNVRMGNPDIEPEYIDSYEIGYQKQIGQGFFSAELYHRKTNNKIERIRSVYSGNVMLQTVDNIGADYSTGLEFMLNMRPASWWMINLMGNAYYYRVEGVIDGSSIDQQSNNWHARFSNTFTIAKNTRLQFDGMYHSPSTTAQGSREGFMFTNLAVRQDLLDKKLTLTAGVRDVFNTAKFGFESTGPGFYSKRNFDMKSPVFSFTLAYKINNYRQKNGAPNGAGDGGMMDVGGEGDF